MGDRCKLCHRPWQEHSASLDAPPLDAVEGDFDGTWRGLYCPPMHNHGNTRHAHQRGDEPHTHRGRRADGGGIEWVTEWPDGTTETRHIDGSVPPRAPAGSIIDAMEEAPR